MERENYRFAITPLGGQTPKNDRIRRLIPKLENGRLYLPYRCLYVDHERKAQDLTMELVNELLAFPVSAYDDIMDCLARILHEEFGVEFPKTTNEIPFGDEDYKVESDYDLFAKTS